MEMHVADTVISSASEEPAGTVVPPYGPQPAHCLVRGEVHRHKGADGVEYGDRFELRMPDAWKGRFLFLGGGGLDGMLAPAVGQRMGAPPSEGALSRGYAVVSTDGGHEGRTPIDASFGSDPGARADYEYASTDRVAVAARQIVAQYYGRDPRYSYMVGCSNGGREAMIAEQRYPSLFDGIVAGDPAFDLTRAAVQEAWTLREFGAIAPKGANGMPLFGEALSDADMTLVSKAILQACDARDGLKDGLIEDTGGCRFDPAVLTCHGAKDATCLTAGQVHALQEAFAGPHDAAGRALYSDFPWDAGIAAPGWRAWILGTAKMPPINFLIYPEFVNHVALPPGAAPLTNALAFNFDVDPERIAQSADKIDATSTDVQGFRAHHGKIIFYNGMSDPIFSADDLIDYYRRLARENGGLQDTLSFARLFLIPGMNHCGGGPALDDFDPLTAITAWVEQGTPPASMTATGRSFPGRSRPLCPYPETAHYKGSGSIEAAANFTCERPRAHE